MSSSSAAQNQHGSSSFSTGDFSSQQTARTSNLDSNAQFVAGNYAPNADQLAGLVEAATAAAGQDVSEWAAAAAVAIATGTAGHNQNIDTYGANIQNEEDNFGNTPFSVGMNRRDRQLRETGFSSGTDQVHQPGLSRTVSRKRKRREEHPVDPALTSSISIHDGDIPQPQQQQPLVEDVEEGELDIRSLHPHQSPPEARSAGIHSGAALFRQTSSNKKHTRPPMSKLFASLELSPENFLHLQAAAKAYMLDERYPERRDCVGQRGKGDAEMVKLRLWNCVRDFLETEGNGERFFSENVLNEGMGPRTCIWPRDQHKIIALVIPLLRRMVTNERQRQYAIETRKSGGSEDRKKRRGEDGLRTSSDGSVQQHDTPEQSRLNTQMPAEFIQGPIPLTPPPPQTHSVNQPFYLGLTDLFEPGYPTDWDTVSRTYELYNRHQQLDHLWSISGLQQPDWRGLIGAVDSHYQISHNGIPECAQLCEDAFLQHLFSSDSMSNLNWRIGGIRDEPARNEFAASITRDVSRIIRDNLATKHARNLASSPSAAPDVDPQLSTPAIQPHLRPNVEPTSTQTSTMAPAPLMPPTSSLSLRINILENGKRVVPRLDMLAKQCPDLDCLRQAILRRYKGQLPVPPSYGPSGATAGEPHVPSPLPWTIKIWLPNGLVPVQTDGEWAFGLLSAESVDWMDGDLKVLVDVGGGAPTS